MANPGIVAAFGRSIMRGDRTFESVREELKADVAEWLRQHGYPVDYPPSQE